MSTPAGSQPPRPPPPPPETVPGGLDPTDSAAAAEEQPARPQEIADPGDQWLPKFLQDKSYVLLHFFSD